MAKTRQVRLPEPLIKDVEQTAQQEAERLLITPQQASYYLAQAWEYYKKAVLVR
jgi:hypothetical protein